MTKRFLLFCVSFLSIAFIQAQDSTSMSADIEEVTVESFFFTQKISSSTSPIGVVTAKDLDGIPLQGIGDALKLEPSISVKSDGTWATAPSIRGLSGQRIIVAVDGNRIETATDINGGMNMINMNDIHQIEIIKSGASSIYGSGAIGGVINFVTHPIVYSSTPTFNAVLNTSYQSVNNLIDEHVRFSASKEKFYYGFSGSFRHASNTQTPAGELLNSQFKDYSANLKFGYRINDQHEVRLQYQNFQARNVGVPGGAAFATPFTVTFPEHARAMSELQYRFSDVTEHIELIKVKAYHQKVFRDVFVETGFPMYSSKLIAMTPSGTHQLWGGLAQADFNIFEQSFSAGIDIWQRNLESSREKFISLPDSSEMLRGELPLPTASYMSNGLFLRTERSFLDDKLKTSAGLRYDYIIVNNDSVYDPVYVIKNGNEINVPRRLTVVENSEALHSWSANLGANYQILPELNVALSGGHSFRAPNIEELYKYINLGATVSIGNPDLIAEKSNFLDLGAHYRKDKISFSVNGFVNKINDMIAEEVGTTTYDNYDSNGNIVSTDTLPALILNNIDEALLFGFDANISYEAIPKLYINANIAYTIGKNLSTDGYLPQIAPMNGLIGVRYTALDYIQGEINCEWAAKQSNIADGETATDGYGIVNINLNSAQYTLGDVKLQAFLGVKNLFNTEYTNHLATNRGGITVEPGTNLFVKLRISL